MSGGPFVARWRSHLRERWVVGCEGLAPRPARAGWGGRGARAPARASRPGEMSGGPFVARWRSHLRERWVVGCEGLAPRPARAGWGGRGARAPARASRAGEMSGGPFVARWRSHLGERWSAVRPASDLRGSPSAAPRSTPRRSGPGETCLAWTSGPAQRSRGISTPRRARPWHFTQDLGSSHTPCFLGEERVSQVNLGNRGPPGALTRRRPGGRRRCRGARCRAGGRRGRGGGWSSAGRGGGRRRAGRRRGGSWWPRSPGRP